MSALIDNERTKLLANALDRASTASLTVGVLAPIAAVIYTVPATGTEPWVFMLGGTVWFSAAIALHLIARLVLRGLVQ